MRTRKFLSSPGNHHHAPRSPSMAKLRERSAILPDVLPMSEARRRLPEPARCFVEKGAEAEPVFFGAHRRPSGVMLSFERYRQMLDLLDDLAALVEIRRRDQADS